MPLDAHPGASPSNSAEPGAAALSLDVPVALIKDPRSWTVEDISVWLHWLGIGEHVEEFVARGVDGRILLQLTAESSWADFGVVDPDQQRVLDSAVEPLRCFRDAEGADTGLALHAIEGPVAGEVFLVGAGGITGGRHSASNGVVLSENYVSRRHFQITRDRAGQHLLQDVGSTTGTFLMVREELVLEQLMVLQLGTTELTVQLEDEICTLVATEGPDKDARSVVPVGGLFVGREASNGLYIRDPQISAFHCEVRYSPEHQGYVLDDKYSTNRTWLRLAPDGQPSKRYPLRIGDLFKVGSTLFHVVDPATLVGDTHSGGNLAAIAASAPHLANFRTGQTLPSLGGSLGGPGAAAAVVAAAAAAGAAGASATQSLGPDSAGAESLEGEGEGDEELDDGTIGYVGAATGQSTIAPSSGSLLATGDGIRDTASSGGGSSPVGEAPSGPQLRWEPFMEGETRPVLQPEEYARRLTASRRRMQAIHAETSARRSWVAGAGANDLHFPQDAGMFDMRERELSSLQQRMRNSRAQTAYTLQQQRQEERRDEDLCKICYDRDIDVVLYPCGHFVLCRWCAQKVSDCPVCRFVITDVIRTYKA